VDLVEDRRKALDPTATFGRDLAAAHDRPSGLTRSGTSFTVTWEKGRARSRKVAPGSA
jgi:hypothetical protein